MKDVFLLLISFDVCAETFFSHTLQRGPRKTRGTNDNICNTEKILRTFNLWLFFHFLWYFLSLRRYFSSSYHFGLFFPLFSFCTEKKPQAFFFPTLLSQILITQLNFFFFRVRGGKFSQFFEQLLAIFFFLLSAFRELQKFHKLFTPILLCFFFLQTRVSFVVFRVFFLVEKNI